MTDNKRKPDEQSYLMATVAAIVDSVLLGETDVLSTQRPTPWKAAYWQDMAKAQRWRSLGWNRV